MEPFWHANVLQSIEPFWHANVLQSMEPFWHAIVLKTIEPFWHANVLQSLEPFWHANNILQFMEPFWHAIVLKTIQPFWHANVLQSLEPFWHANVLQSMQPFWHATVLKTIDSDFQPQKNSMVIIKKLPVTNHFATAGIRCIYDVKFVWGKLTKDIQSYASRYLELCTLPYIFQYFPYNVLKAWHRKRVVHNLLSAAGKTVCLWFDRL